MPAHPSPAPWPSSADAGGVEPRRRLNPTPMRTWLFHPLIFYPLVLIAAAAVIILSLQPQAWPRPAAAVAGQVEGQSLVLQGDAFNSPADSPDQYITVVRDALGRPQSLRVATLEDRPAPRDSEHGAVIELSPEAQAFLSDKRLAVEISYRPLPVNAAPELAIGIISSARTRWVTRPIPPLMGSANFVLPAQREVRGIGLRPLIGGPSMTYGVEIVSIRITPQAGR